MNQVPEITEIDVQNWVGARSFQKGYRYFEDDTILNPRKRGSCLIAECQGTQPTPYRVEIRLGPDGILEGHCTCAAGEGGHCKHAAALLLTWLEEPDVFLEVPELEQLLESRSKAELIALVQQMVNRHPDLEQLLELSALSILSPGEQIPAERITKQVQWAFSSAGGELAGANAQIAENLQPILDMGEDFIDREDVVNAATVYSTLMTTMMDYEDCLYNDEGGDLGQVLAECEQGIEECLRNLQDPKIRADLLHTLFDFFNWDLEAGGLGYADEIPAILISQSMPEEKHQIAEWVQDELPDGEDWDSSHQARALGGLWLGLMADNMDDETYLRICRETHRTRDLTDRLLELSQLDEALTVARAASDGEITRFADLFEKHGYSDQARQLVKERPGSTTNIALLEWLKEYALMHNEHEEALRLAETLFWQAQNLENYYALLEAAAVQSQRDKVRARVLQRLESAGNFSLLVEIYLLENEVDLALAALERINPDTWWGRKSGLRRQVAQAVETPRPREAIRQYLLLAEEAIQQRSRTSYAEAARLLMQVRKLYHGLAEEDRWRQIITRFGEEYRRLPAFMDELRRAGLL